MGSDSGFLKSLEEKDVCVYACMLNIHIHTYIYIYIFLLFLLIYFWLCLIWGKPTPGSIQVGI